MKYVQITSGRGPVECCRVVVLVMNALVEQAHQCGLAVELLESEDSQHQDCKFSVTLSVDGDSEDSLAQEWEGSVLWVASKNRFRPWHRRKNWFVGVHFFAPLESNTIDEHDIAYETMRA